MKKLPLSLLILLFPALLHAQCIVGQMSVAGKVAAASGYCTAGATCTASTPGQCDVICEDFEGSTDCDDGATESLYCRNAYTVTIAAGDAVTWATPTNGLCTDEGSYAVDFDVNGGSRTTIMAYDTGADKAIVHVQFYLYVVDENLADKGTMSVMYGQTSAPATAWGIMVKQATGGDKVLRLAYWQNTGAMAYVDGTTPLTVGSNTWYRVQLVYDTTGGTATVTLNGTSEISVADVQTSSPRQTQIIKLGSLSSWGSAAAHFQLDNIAIDDDTAQGACN